VLLKDFLASPVAALQRSRPSAEDFGDFLRRVFAAYVEGLEGLDTNDVEVAEVHRRLNAVKVACGQLPNAIEATYSGKPDECVEVVDGTLEMFQTEIDRLSRLGPATEDPGSLYRMRMGGPARRYSCGDLFHIPYDKRHLIANQRYSFPGLPCLYLGRSLYVCWEELGRPDLNQVAIAKCKLRDGESVRILDLSYRPRDVSTAPQPQTRIDVATIWPLLAACSVKVEPYDALFRAEYVVPQSVLRWLLKHDRFDGLSYCSTHVLDDVSAGVAVN
jgi:hypothetical protein